MKDLELEVEVEVDELKLEMEDSFTGYDIMGHAKPNSEIAAEEKAKAIKAAEKSVAMSWEGAWIRGGN